MLKPLEVKFWQEYLATLAPSERPSNPKVYASFAGNREIANKLLALYLEGKKTAGSSLLEDYQSAGDPLPEAGNYWIILDSESIPRCIVRTERVELHKFNEVPESVARAEGEGDASLDYWRKAHIKFFTPFLPNWGVNDINATTVITEFFKIVHRSDSEL